MSEHVRTCAPSLPPINEREVLRYMGARDATDEVKALLSECIVEAKDVFTPRACYRVFDLDRDGTGLDLGFAKTDSISLSKALSGCDRVILFAATVGIGIDRLINRYTRISPSRAVSLGAIGAERIEALCDALCQQLARDLGARGYGLRPRFSAGYGDLPLSLQRDIFDVLECSKSIGLTLNESLLMSPAKSVTALVGVSRNA